MKEFQSIGNYGRRRTIICMGLAVLIAGIVTGIFAERRIWLVEAKAAAAQQKLAGEVLRFHVLANSDRQEDQELKMRVKEKILCYMKDQLPDAKSIEMTREWTGSHKQELEKVAKQEIEQAGYDYPVSVTLTTDYFPEKTYGDITFPAGNYEALRVEIGKAMGHNWWCVLYPNLCFIDAVHAVVPEEGKEQLQSVLDEEAYEMVTTASTFKIKWFFLGED